MAQMTDQVRTSVYHIIIPKLQSNDIIATTSFPAKTSIIANLRLTWIVVA